MLVTGEATGSFRFAFSPSKLDSCPAKIRNIAVKIAQKQQINRATASKFQPPSQAFGKSAVWLQSDTLHFYPPQNRLFPSG